MTSKWIAAARPLAIFPLRPNAEVLSDLKISGPSVRRSKQKGNSGMRALANDPEIGA
jgi:hypothetical protein